MACWYRLYFLLLISTTLGQNVTRLQELCDNNGNPLHVSLISIPTKGHINPLIGIGQQLVQLGCRVTVPIVETKVSWVSSSGLEPFVIPLREGEVDDVPMQNREKLSKESNENWLLQIASDIIKGSGENSTSPIQILNDLTANIARHLLSENAAGRYHPDLIITERYLILAMDVAEVLKVPVIGMQPSLYVDIMQDPVHYIPATGMPFPLDMNYLQRIASYYLLPYVMQATANFLAGPAIKAREELGITNKLSKVNPYERSPIVELVQTCWGFEYTRPVLPTTHLIGPVLPLTLKPIPQNLLDWVNEDDRDIVYMSMGTVATITPKLASAFVEAFSGQSYRVLWALPENQRDSLEGLEIPPNVHLEKFVPQREILLLDRIKVFISHTGASSANEALTSGTPVICMPYFGDQGDFCARIETAGSGLRLDKNNLNASIIKEKVLRALRDPEIQKNALRMQQIMDCGGSLKAADIILHAFTFGSEHLMPHYLHLPWYQKYALDLRITNFVFLTTLPILIYLVFKCCRCCCRCCFGRTNKSQPLKLKTQ